MIIKTEDNVKIELGKDYWYVFPFSSDNNELFCATHVPLHMFVEKISHTTSVDPIKCNILPSTLDTNKSAKLRKWCDPTGFSGYDTGQKYKKKIENTVQFKYILLDDNGNSIEYKYAQSCNNQRLSNIFYGYQEAMKKAYDNLSKIAENIIVKNERLQDISDELLEIFKTHNKKHPKTPGSNLSEIF